MQCLTMSEHLIQKVDAILKCMFIQSKNSEPVNESFVLPSDMLFAVLEVQLSGLWEN